jgi:hypothetical protein
LYGGFFIMAPFTKALPLLAALCVPLPAAEEEDAFTDLFNGKDLTGWVNVNCAPETWTVKDGVIVCTGVPTGLLRTEKQYENYILELEWRHLKKGGNAGLFVHSDALTSRGQPFSRSIECQIMDGNHGDVFAIHGATFVPDRPHPQGWMRCLPSESRAHPAGGEWNRYVIRCAEGRVQLSVNGKVVSGGTECKPRKGYIVLESEGSEVHFRRIRIHQLAPSDPPPVEVAEKDEGFRPLYSGLDLRGWKADGEAGGGWKAKDWILENEGAGRAAPLKLEKPPESFELILDYRRRADGVPGVPLLFGRRRFAPDAAPEEGRGGWHRARLAIEKGRARLVSLDGKPTGAEIPLEPGPVALALDVPPGGIQFANIFVKE